MKPKLKIIIPAILFSCLLAFLAFHTVQAQGLVGCTDNCQLSGLVFLVVRIINYLFSIAGLVAMVFIVWSGWNMIIAAGNEEAITKAKQGFSHAIIGLFLVIIAFVLIDAIVGILGGFSLNQLLNFLPK